MDSMRLNLTCLLIMVCAYLVLSLSPNPARAALYDSASNRTSWDDGTAVNYTIPAGSNKTSAVGGDSYTYDDAGNITDDGTNSYTWNAAGDLATVNTTDGVYRYDWQHRRVKKVAASTTTYYVYGPGGLLFGEYDSSGDMVREYIYLNPSPEALAQGGGEPLAQIDAGSPETLTYLHTDHLGAPRYGTNTGGTQVWSWGYDAFGDGGTSGSVTVNLRLPGQYYDAESGLYYNWNRYYNPVIGRYISSDPIGLAGGMNTYNYANVSPLMYTDPWGLESAENYYNNNHKYKTAQDIMLENGPASLITGVILLPASVVKTVITKGIQKAKEAAKDEDTCSTCNKGDGN